MNEKHRNICLIPASAHGTNPASAACAGLKIVQVLTDHSGNINVEDMKKKAELNKKNLSTVMITYPSTHGVFEDKIKEMIDIVHHYGGQVYMDGANMNAQIGYTSPGYLGADVCHLNLHKSFAGPHGGGGPGMGPIGVKKHLVPYLPTNPIVMDGNNAISSNHYGSPAVTLFSYGYIKQLGYSGLRKATANAILNANYLRSELGKHFKILYTGTEGFCAHEFILDLRPIKAESGISDEDIAKRLMDFNIHGPTMSFPVHGTLMIEPTESEDKAELDRFIAAFLKIKEEIEKVKTGVFD